MDQIWLTYQEIPVVTRGYVTACALTTVGCQLQFINAFQLYFNPDLIKQGQVWRILTNFLYFGNFSLDLIFHLFFLTRYSKMLEESSFRNRSADFCFMLIFGGTLLLIIAPFTNILFLGSALTFMMVYLWGRRNKNIRMNFLGLFTFTAPYLPWVLLAFSLLIGQSILTDLLGILVGHIYYYLEDFYPTLTGRHLLKTPMLLKHLLNEVPDAPVPGPTPVPGLPVVHPGGFDWQAGADQAEVAQGTPVTTETQAEVQEEVMREAAPFAGLRQRQRQMQQEREEEED